jgi:hypothetical protein
LVCNFCAGADGVDKVGDRGSLVEFLTVSLRLIYSSGR